MTEGGGWRGSHQVSNPFDLLDFLARPTRLSRKAGGILMSQPRAGLRSSKAGGRSHSRGGGNLVVGRERR